MINKLILVAFFLLIFSAFAYAQPEVMISEIYYDTPNDSEMEFVEFYVYDDDGSTIDVSGWYIDDYDGNQLVLPSITDLENFDYVSIKIGSCVSDLDASDGSATICYNLGYPILDAADEIGLYDSFNITQDFVLYNGGNSGVYYENWNPLDLGIVQDNTLESIQVHGPDEDNSENLVSAPPTEADPNQFSTELGVASLPYVNVIMRNGLNRPITIDPLSKYGSLRFEIVNESGSINISELKIIEEMMNFSLDFYRDKGFNDPRTNASGVIYVGITKNGKFAAAASPDGTIELDIGGDLSNLSIASFIKWNLEHEFYHLIEYERFYPNGTVAQDGDYNRDPVDYAAGRFAFMDEGQAEYWGIEISKKQYNVTADYLFNASQEINNAYPNFNSIEYDFADILSDFDFDLTGLGTGTKKVYSHGYLFTKFLADRYWESKLVHIHRVTKNNVSGSGNETIGEDALIKAFKEQGIDKSFENLWPEWAEWLYDNYGARITYTNEGVVGNGALINETETIPSYGIHFEKFNNTNTSQGININFEGDNNTNYSIIIVRHKDDGTVSKSRHHFKGKFNISLWDGIKEIVLIKTQPVLGPDTTYNLKISTYDFPVPDIVIHNPHNYVDYPVAGEPVVFSFDLYNVGPADADNVYWSIDPDSDYASGVFENINPKYIEGNTFIEVMTFITYDYPGTYYPTIIADPLNLVEEINESNNEIAFEIQVGRKIIPRKVLRGVER